MIWIGLFATLAYASIHHATPSNQTTLRFLFANRDLLSRGPVFDSIPDFRPNELRWVAHATDDAPFQLSLHEEMRQHLEQAVTLYEAVSINIQRGDDPDPAVRNALDGFVHAWFAHELYLTHIKEFESRGETTRSCSTIVTAFTCSMMTVMHQLLLHVMPSPPDPAFVAYYHTLLPRSSQFPLDQTLLLRDPVPRECFATFRFVRYGWMAFHSLHPPSQEQYAFWNTFAEYDTLMSEARRFLVHTGKWPTTFRDWFVDHPMILFKGESVAHQLNLLFEVCYLYIPGKDQYLHMEAWRAMEQYHQNHVPTQDSRYVAWIHQILNILYPDATHDTWMSLLPPPVERPE